jgi:hypothetical protein
VRGRRRRRKRGSFRSGEAGKKGKRETHGLFSMHIVKAPFLSFIISP